jgi:aminoglycoside phosphotransferase (APT) family kinase protein
LLQHVRERGEATLGFDVTDARWSLAPPTPHEVICHNDFAPYNCVFREGRFVGAIDFDLCAPGPRLWDIAYTAYRFVPLMPVPDADVSAGLGERSLFSAVDGSARLLAFRDAYSSAGAPLRYEPLAVIAATIDRLRAIAASYPPACRAGKARPSARWLARAHAQAPVEGRYARHRARAG